MKLCEIHDTDVCDNGKSKDQGRRGKIVKHVTIFQKGVNLKKCFYSKYNEMLKIF